MAPHTNQEKMNFLLHCLRRGWAEVFVKGVPIQHRLSWSDGLPLSIGPNGIEGTKYVKSIPTPFFYHWVDVGAIIAEDGRGESW